MAEAEDESYPPETQKLPTEFAFSELSNLKVVSSEQQPTYDTARSSLLAVANKYGYVFAGTPEGLKVFRSSDVLEAGRNGQKEVASPVATISLRNPPNWIAVNSDNLTLSLCSRTNKGPQVLFFDIRNIVSKSKATKTPFYSLYLNKDPNAYVTSMKWNPSQEWPNLLALCLSSGSFHLLSIQETATEIAIRPDDFGASSVCWSPKGKQMIIGKKDGTLHQFTQKMEVRRTVTVTNVIDQSVQTCDILWLSTYQVAAAYVASEDDSFTQPNLFLANMPSKNEQRDVEWKSFNDPCFGMNDSRESRYFFTFLDQWQLFVTLSSNSTDTAVIAQNKTTQKWEIWSLDDSSRATLPISEYTEDDSSPVGAGVILTSTERIPLGEAKDCGPMPVLAILTNDGVVCLYHMINLMPEYPALTRPADKLDLTGERAAVGSVVPGEGGTAKTPGPSVKPKLSAKPSLPPMSTPKASVQALGDKFESSNLAKPFSASTPVGMKLPPFSEGPSIIQQPLTTSKPTLMREILAKVAPSAPPKHLGHDDTADSVFGSVKSESSESVFTKTSQTSQPPLIRPLKKSTTPSNGGTGSTQDATLTPGFFKIPPSRGSSTMTSRTNDSLSRETPATSVTVKKPELSTLLPKSSTKTTLTSQPSVRPSSQDKKAPTQSAKSSNVDLTATLDDITNFERELSQFQRSISETDEIEKTIGGGAEKAKMLKDIELLNAFSKEIRQTARELSNEIQDTSTALPGLLFDAEDVNRKQNRTSSGAYKAHLYGRPLERSKRQKLEIPRLNYVRAF